MTDEEMRSTVEGLLDDARFAKYVPSYIEIAKSAVMARLFPFRDDAEWGDVPAKHHGRACQIAVYLANRRGAEGEVSHSENGVSRTYGSADIPEAYLDGLKPFVGVPL